jgi:hypothetical protein
MKMFEGLKRRFPKLFPVAAVVGVLSGIGGIAAYERLASGECCAPGASCCQPGAACCNQHKQQQHAAK